MSTEAIDEVVSELQTLPESDQKLFLSFVKELKLQRAISETERKSAEKPSALKMVDGLLVYTGELLEPDKNWVQAMHEERINELIRQVMGDKPVV